MQIAKEKTQELAPVSVVIPCYRCEDTIRRTVDSVARQTWRPAELILVDDGSEDASVDVLRDLEKEHGRNWLKLVLLTENRGPADARNAGWDVAGQPFVSFLDADDTWHQSKVEIQLKYMLSHPEISISGHGRRWLREGEALQALPESYRVKPLPGWRILLANPFSSGTVMLQRDLPLRFRAGKRYAEDYLLWSEIICSGRKAVLIDLELLYLHKAPYGAGGLSGKLWSMEKGELDAYWSLHTGKLVSRPACLALASLSICKYARRVAVNFFKRAARGATHLP
jgi:glycosyltransferase involved in cell wall biosynthesis